MIRLLSFVMLLLCSTLFARDLSVTELKKIIQNEDASTIEAILANPKRFNQLANEMLKTDVMLLSRVDKTVLLPSNYAPIDLVSLDSLEWTTVNRSGHQLRAVVLPSLKQMSLDAQKEGITLIISSCYRSYNYQQQVYKRWTDQLGEQEANRVSAPAGSSQHQLGLVVDFGSINQSFNNTKAERWLNANAYKYGWSLSFPDNYEKETGYRYESWHYRYIGPAAVAMQREFFNNLQYKTINFWHQHHKAFL